MSVKRGCDLCLISSCCLLQERGPPNLGFGNMTGGFMMGGQAGTLKMTLPTAFTISMLAWSMLEFPQVCAQGLLLAVAFAPLQTPYRHSAVAGLPPNQLAETLNTPAELHSQNAVVPRRESGS